VASEPPKEIAAMTTSRHPGPETLGRFVLGRLNGKAMARVEGHLRGCTRCAQVAMQVPDDRLVMLLRASAAGPTTEPAPDNAASSP
jgi:anti-sigma factor RsiW